VCTDVRNSPDEGYPPRGFYTAATGPVRILVVGKNPGHILPHEAARYTGKPAAEVARAHLGFAGATFEGAQHAEPVSSRSTMFHRRLRRYLVTVLGVAEDDVFKHAAYTNLVKCSTADEQARLHAGTMRECFARHLQREIAFFVPVALLALGGEVAHFLRRAARSGMHDRPVLRVKHPSYPYRKDELDAVLEDLRRQLVALSARGAR
jgi:uracil-DNA glycosylase